MVSEIRFSSLHTHELLYASLLRRKDVLDSSMAFLILSAWDAVTDALLRELERNDMQVVVCYITDSHDLPDLSGHKNCSLIPVSPYQELTKELAT